MHGTPFISKLQFKLELGVSKPLKKASGHVEVETSISKKYWPSGEIFRNSPQINANTQL